MGNDYSRVPNKPLPSYKLGMKNLMKTIFANKRKVAAVLLVKTYQGFDREKATFFESCLPSCRQKNRKQEKLKIFRIEEKIQIICGDLIS